MCFLLSRLQAYFLSLHQDWTRHMPDEQWQGENTGLHLVSLTGQRDKPNKRETKTERTSSVTPQIPLWGLVCCHALLQNKHGRPVCSWKVAALPWLLYTQILVTYLGSKPSQVCVLCIFPWSMGSFQPSHNIPGMLGNHHHPQLCVCVCMFVSSVCLYVGLW